MPVWLKFHWITSRGMGFAPRKTMNGKDEWTLVATAWIRVYNTGYEIDEVLKRAILKGPVCGRIVALDA
ncbi:hypothetical protein LIER_04482 [Lithospermum erythrorhizon]|uniref:Uncharacterized protein n=1 Tax=Lithospermum erythrorhizon TaxID=34254 RepID=A0AAV3NWW0_LITER